MVARRRNSRKSQRKSNKRRNRVQRAGGFSFDLTQEPVAGRPVVSSYDDNKPPQLGGVWPFDNKKEEEEKENGTNTSTLNKQNSTTENTEKGTNTSNKQNSITENTENQMKGGKKSRKNKKSKSKKCKNKKGKSKKSKSKRKQKGGSSANFNANSGNVTHNQDVKFDCNQPNWTPDCR